MTTSSQAFNPTDPSTPGPYGPLETALLLLDFHSLFVGPNIGGPNSPAALKVAAQMRTWAKSQGITVIHGLVDIDATPFPTCKDAGRFKSIVDAMNLGGGEESPELSEGSSEDESIFKRIPGYVSVLESPGLKEFLQEKGIKSLILTGLSTSGCVLRTAIPATDAEFVVSVLSDGCADRDEEVHKLVVERILPTRAYVFTAAEFREQYIKSRGNDSEQK